jgi:hypothetical protein
MMAVGNSERETVPPESFLPSISKGGGVVEWGSGVRRLVGKEKARSMFLYVQKAYPLFSLKKAFAL